MRKTQEEKIQENYEKDMKKLLPYGVKVDEQGRYLVCIDKSNNFTKAYFSDKTGARVRIFSTTFYRWIEEGKAVEVPEEELPRRKKKRPYEYKTWRKEIQ